MVAVSYATFNAQLDEVRSQLTRNLTPESLLSLIDSAEEGDLSTWLLICEEIADKDTRVSAVLKTRRIAVTGLPWSIEPAPEAGDTVLASEVASWLAEYFSDRVRAREFSRFLLHNSSAFGTGLAVTEKVYPRAGNLAELLPVSSSRLVAEYQESRRVRVRTKANPSTGIIADANRFVVFMPHSTYGLPVRGAPMRPVVFLWLAKSFGFKDWLNFSERYGMPSPIGYYDGASDHDKKIAQQGLARMASGFSAIIPRSFQVEFAEIGDRTSEPYSKLIEYCNREISIAVLGQNLTTDTTSGTGTYAAAEVHDRVRNDIRASDIAAEAECVRNQLFAQIVGHEWGIDAPVPVFVRNIATREDPATIESRLRAAQMAGLTVSRSQLRDELRLSAPSDDDSATVSAPGPAGGFFGATP